MFNSFVLHMGGTFPDRNELLYIRFPIQSTMGGTALIE